MHGCFASTSTPADLMLLHCSGSSPEPLPGGSCSCLPAPSPGGLRSAIQGGGWSPLWPKEGVSLLSPRCDGWAWGLFPPGCSGWWFPSRSGSFPAPRDCCRLPGAFPGEGRSPSQLLLLSHCPKAGPPEPPQPWLPGARLIHHRCSLLPPAFNSRGSNELGQRSMLSAPLRSGLYSDTRETLQQVELF